MNPSNYILLKTMDGEIEAQTLATCGAIPPAGLETTGGPVEGTSPRVLVPPYTL